MHIFICASYCSFSQGVGIGTGAPDISAVLDITASGKGLLIPRMSTAATLAINTPAKGLLLYDSSTNNLLMNTGTAANPAWQALATNVNVWNIAGNSNTSPFIQFIGTTDNQPLHFRINNVQAGELHPVTGNIFWGVRAGQLNTTGFSNIAIGTDALRLNNRSNLVAIGDSALFHNGFGSAFLTNSVSNTAIGSKALFTNALGSENTAVGYQSLQTNSDGGSNTATGSQSLFSNTIGSSNVANGAQALQFNTTGSDNTAVGSASLQSNSTGSSNTATGAVSMQLTTTGFNNTANGTSALRFNTSGFNNTAIGLNALFSNTTGSSNTAVGNSALLRNSTSQFNTAVGFNAADNFDMGFNNTIIGANADVNQNSLFNCVALGQAATCTANSQVRFGNSSTTSIGGIVGYSNLSDGRYKKNIQGDVKGIDFIMKLKPVTYQLDVSALSKKLNESRGKAPDEVSKTGIAVQEKTIFSGFVAQDVEQAAKATGYNFSGVDKPKNENDLYGLRYAEFVVPLVKAVQEQQQTINELKRQNTDLLKRILALEKKIKAACYQPSYKTNLKILL